MHETRRYDAMNDKTISLRSKEEDIDYRFLVDPDIPTFQIKQDRVERVRSSMIKTPFENKTEFLQRHPDLELAEL